MERPDLQQVRAKLAAEYQQRLRQSPTTVDPELLRAPQPYFAELMSRGRVTDSDGHTTFLRRADSVEVMRDKAVVQPGNGLLMGSPRPLIPLDLDGPVHVKYRKLLDPLFAPQKVAA